MAHTHGHNDHHGAHHDAGHSGVFVGAFLVFIMLITVACHFLFAREMIYDKALAHKNESAAHSNR